MGLPAWFPPVEWEALHVALRLDGGGRPPRLRQHAIAFGALDRSFLKNLWNAGVTCACVDSIADAVSLLGTEPCDLILVDPAAAGALAFIKTVKAVPGGLPVLPGDEIAILRDKYRRTPVMVLPLASDKEYAVILNPPKLAWLETIDVLPVLEAIRLMDVDVLEGDRDKDPRPS